MNAELLATFRDGLVALAREEIDAAEPLLRAVVAGAPDDADALAYLATAWIAQGRVEAAREAMDLALTLGPDRFGPNMKAGELDLRLGNLDAAEIHIKQALRVAVHGSRDAAAARTLLGETRRRASRSITRKASFPRWRRPAFLHRPDRGRLSIPVEDGGGIE